MQGRHFIILIVFYLLPIVVFASGSSTAEVIFPLLLPYVEIIGFFSLIILVFYLVNRKMTPTSAQKKANKLFGKAIVSADYCMKYSVSDEQLLELIGSGQLGAFEGAGLLFVEDVPPGGRS